MIFNLLPLSRLEEENNFSAASSLIKNIRYETEQFSSKKAIFKYKTHFKTSLSVHKQFSKAVHPSCSSDGFVKKIFVKLSLKQIWCFLLTALLAVFKWNIFSPPGRDQ